MNEQIVSLRAEIKGGVLPAMATPISEDGSRVNGPIIDLLVDFLINAGVKGLFVGGSTGEGILLDLDQRKVLHERAVIAARGRIPVLVHVGSNTTADSINLAKHASDIGVQGIVAVTPYFYSVHDEAILSHFRSIAAAAPDLPFFGYDIPHMAVNGISPTLLADLMVYIPNFAGIKTSNSNAQVIRKLIDTVTGEKIVLVGNERIALGSLAMGADGLISGMSTAVPEPFVSLVRAFCANQLDAARDIQKTINKILDLMPAGARIGAIKRILDQRGIHAGPPLAPRPVPSADWQAWQKIQAWIE
jgi:dihydrodipicolinate synthase/N-acetylneuraminate lyase